MTPDGGAWTWNQLAGVPGTGSFDRVVSIQGTSGDVWILMSTGEVLRSTGGAFQRVFRFEVPRTGFARQGQRNVFTDPTGFSWCDGEECLSESSLHRQTSGLEAPQKSMICAQGARISALFSGSGSPVFEWTDGRFQSLGPLGAHVQFVDPPACWFDEQGRAVFPELAGLMVVNNGSSSHEHLAGDNVSMLGGASIPGVSWAVGDHCTVARRDSTTWSLVPCPEPDATLQSVALLAPNEVYVFGFGYSLYEPLAYRVNGSNFEPLTGIPSFPGHARFRNTLVTAGNELFLAGSSDYGPFVLRASR